MTRILTRNCKKCGREFSFTCIGHTKSELNNHLNWAIEKVTLCHICRPDYRWIAENRRRMRIGSTWRDAGN